AHEIIQALDALGTPSETVAPRARAARRVSRVGLGAIAIVVIAAAGATWLAFGHRSRAAAAENRLLVAPFTNLTGNPAFDNVGRSAYSDRRGNGRERRRRVQPRASGAPRYHASGA